jgi:integrase
MPYDQIGKFMKDLRASVYHGASGYCPICASPHRAEIEAARRADNGVVGRSRHPSATSYHSIAARFGVHAGMIWRHLHRGHEQRPAMTYMKRPKSSYAIDLIILTAVRKDQVLGAEWTEIDWNERTLTSPAWKVLGEEQGHKTGKKSQEDYVTPLCDDAMDILRTMKKWQEDNGIKSKFIFPSEGNPHGKKSTGKMAHHTVNAPVKRLGKRLGFPDLTVHGFRTTFSTWASDHDYDEKDIEMQLGHIVGNPVRNKYKDKRVVLRIKQRRKMMEDWADYCRRVELLPADVISSFHSEETLQP